MLHGSFLDHSYLGQSDLDLATPSQPPQMLAAPLAGTDLVTLPGGIVMQRKTLIMLGIAIAVVAAAYLWRKKQESAT
jgi:hypothetical protein